jgi:hypothetical protein
MRESNGTRNLGHRQIVASQQLFRALDFTLDDMLVQGHSHRRAGDMEGASSGFSFFVP